MVSVADPSKIDFETAAGHAYTVTVKADDGLATTTQSFSIAVSDVAPSAPTDSNAAANTVVEGAANGSTVGVTASSTDVNGPAVTYSLTGDNSGGGFTINAATGVVTVADSTKIDFETAAGHAYTVTAQASDGTLTRSQTFTIAVTDAAPSTPVDSNAAANTVAEGAANGSTVGVTASSTDVNGPAVTYSLTGDTSGGGFTINAATGVVTVADPTKIDYETAAGHAYTITAQASDGTLSSSQTFIIAVTDVLPSTPVDSNAATNTVAEGAANGSTVGVTAFSTDVNGPAVTYSLTGDTSSGGFAIDAATGIVTVADSTKIDFESSGVGHSYTVTAQANDGAGTSSQTFSIAVTDVAPSTPVDSNAAANTVAEGAANGSTVGVTASSTDVNGPALTWSLTGDSSGGGFAINAATGVVTVADATKIDYESAPGHAYTVTAQASDGTLTSSQTFTIAVADVAPSTPVDSNAAANTVAEGAANGSTVGVTASSTDVNGPAVTYSLTGDTSGGGFTINSATGVVTVADSTKIDYETAAGHAYTVTAQASDGTLSSSQAFTIGVTDVAPSTPVDSNAATNTIAEGAANGSTVGVTAFSTDVNGPAVTYSLTGDTSSGGFAIDPTTGIVTVANSTKIDFESSGGSYTVTAQASDGTLTSSQTFSIAVTDVAPSTPVDSDAATNQVSQGAPVGTHTGVTASSADVNGPAVTYSLTGDTSGGGFTINSATGVVTVADPTKVVYNAGSPTFDVTVDASDGTLHSQQTFTINVLQNTPPVANDDSVSATEAGGLNNAVVGVNPSGNVILGTGAAGDVQDTDAQDPSSALTVVAVHTGPEGGSIAAGTVGSPLTGSHGTLTLNADGSYTYLVNQTDAQVQALANSTETIQDVFNYTIQDTGGLQDAASLTITIHGAGDLPQAVADTGTMTQNDAPTLFDVIANDTQDPDHTASNAITVGPGGITVTGPAGETFANTDATASIVGNKVQVTLTNSHFLQLTGSEHATVTVPYTLTGDALETSTASLVVTVNGVNDVPVAVDDTPAAITEDQVGTFTVLANDTLDPDHGAPNNVTTGTVTNLVAPSGEGITTADVGVSVNGSNQVVVTLGANFQHMQDGQTATFDVPYTLHGDQPGDTSTATLHVTVDGANDAPTASNFTFNGVNSATANTDLVVDGPGAGTPDPAGPQKTISGDLLGGASDVDGPGPLVVVAGTITTAHNGTVTMLANGDFTYKPAVGYTGADSFTYTVSDQNPGVAGTANGTVNLNVIAPKVWYVNADAGTDGDGSSEHPFNTLSHFAGVGGVDGAGDTIFLETSSAHYTGGLTLENNEQLISQSNGLVVPDGGVGAGTVTLVAASGANAVIDGGVVLGSGDTIQGVDFGTNAGGFALSGSNVGTIHVDDVTSGVINNSTGGGVSIGGSSNVLHMDFSSVTTGGGTSGIALGGSSGTFHAHGGTLSNASGAEVALSSGTFNFTDDGAINNTNGTNVSISNMNSTIDFNGAITGHGIALSSNTGSTMSFDGGMTLSTGASNAFGATGGGTVTVTGTNHLTTTTGTALDIANTTIGSGNVTFHDINANGAVNGIVLNSTGASGGLIVAGDAGSSNNSSGGTIQNTTGAGISLTSTENVSFDQMNIQSTGDSGVNGTGVTNFSFTNGTIANAGNASFESAISFNGLGVTAQVGDNIDGTLTVTGNTFTNAFYSGLDVQADNGTVTNANISNNTISNPGATAINFVGTGNSSTAFNLDNATIANNTISGVGADGIQVNISNANASGPGAHAGFVTFDGLGRPISDPSHIISITGNSITSMDVNSTQAIAVSNGGGNSSSRTQTNFEIKNNGTVGTPLGSSSIGTVILIGNNGYSDMAGLVDSNVIVATQTANLGGGNGIAGGNGVSGAGSAWTPKLDLTVTNNTISGTDGNGILLVGRGTSGEADFKVADNNVAAPVNLGGTARQGIRIDAGNASSADDAVFLNIFGNTSAGSNGAAGIGVRKQGTVATTNDFGIFDAAGGPSLVSSPSNLQVQTFITALNPGSVGGTDIINGSNFLLDTTRAPPLLAASGGVQAATPTTGETHLTQSELDSVVAAAIAQWAHAGASSAQLAALTATIFSVADLPGNTIGEQTPGHIVIDTDAAGHGWFVDPTPRDNSEFSHAQNAAGTDLLTDPTNAAAGHLDLLTTVTHELGHVLGLPDSTAPGDVNDLMYINLVDGERRVASTADVTQANANVAQTGASLAQASEAALPASAQAQGGAPIVVGTAGNDTIDAGFGGKILFGGAGADNFVFGHDIQLNTPAAPSAQPITHVADYSAAQGDTFDFSALTSAFHATNIADASLVRVVEDHSGTFATLQFNTTASAPLYPNAPPGMLGAANWVNVAQIDGAHSGDAVNVLVDSHSAVHLAHLHVDLLA